MILSDYGQEFASLEVWDRDGGLEGIPSLGRDSNQWEVVAVAYSASTNTICYTMNEDGCFQLYMVGAAVIA